MIGLCVEETKVEVAIHICDITLKSNLYDLNMHIYMNKYVCDMLV